MPRGSLRSRAKLAGRMNRLWRIDVYPRVTDIVPTLGEMNRIAFATACAERGLRRVDAWLSDGEVRPPTIFRHAVDVLWRFVAGEASVAEVRTLEHAVRNAIPDPDEEEITFGADRATLAVLYAIQSALRPKQKKLAIKAAMESYLAWGSVETLRESSPVTIDVMDERERRLPILQREIDFQDELLRVVAAGSNVNGPELVALTRRVVEAT